MIQISGLMTRRQRADHVQGVYGRAVSILRLKTVILQVLNIQTHLIVTSYVVQASPP